MEAIAGSRIVPSVEMLFTTEPSSFEAEVKEFTELCVSGMNLRRVATSHFGLFEGRLSEGANLRFLLVDPDSDAVPIIADRNYVYRDPEKLKAAIESSLESLVRLGTGRPIKGSIEIRVLRYVPSYGLTLVDPDRLTGRIRVDLYPYRVPPENYPCFWIEGKTNGKWYQFFRDQFQALWDAAKPINSSPSE
jgi:hypothetical protein